MFKLKQHEQGYKVKEKRKPDPPSKFPGCSEPWYSTYEDYKAADHITKNKVMISHFVTFICEHTPDLVLFTLSSSAF